MLTFDLTVDRIGRCIISYSGTHHSHITYRECLLTFRQHFAGRFDMQSSDTGMFCGNAYRPRHKDYFGSARGALLGYGITHFTGRIVADKSHWVYFLISRTGCDKHGLTIHVTFAREIIFKIFNYVFRLLHTAFPLKPAGEKTTGRLYDMVAIRRQ